MKRRDAHTKHETSKVTHGQRLRPIASWVMLFGISLLIVLTVDFRCAAQSSPPNDTCTGAIELTHGVTNSVETFNATEFGDPTAICGYAFGRGVWYKLTTPPTAVRVNINTCASTFRNSMLAVYTNQCGGTPPVACSDGSSPFCSDRAEAGVSFGGLPNTTYYILVGGYVSEAGTLRIVARLDAPPPNDTCTGAIELTHGVTNSVETFNATEFGDPGSACDGYLVGRGVWFRITPPAGARTTISTCGSDFDTQMVVYRDDCDLREFVVCNSDNGPACSGGQSSVNFADESGASYLIYVGGYLGAWGHLRIVATVAPPPNDLCLGAIEMIPGLTYAVNTLNATQTQDPVPACSSRFRGGVWYTFQPAVSGPVAINTCGSTVDTALAVYAGSCNSLTPVACAEDDGPICAGNRASLNLNANAGTRYYILAGGRNDEAGDLRITVGVVDLASTRLDALNVIVGGRRFAASLTVLNLGLNSINASWVDRLSLSNSSTNIVLQDLRGPHNAPAGGSYTDSFESTPPPLPDGVYTLTARVDLANRVAETQEDNNTISVSVTVSNIRPAVVLLSPSNSYQATSCVPIVVRLAAQVKVGSYDIAKVEFFDNGKLIDSDTASPYYIASPMLSHGTHAITAQAVDIFGTRSLPSEMAMVSVNWPGLHQLLANRSTNHDVVCCMGALPDRSYIIEAATEMTDSAVWQSYLTNRITESPLLIFTNHLPLLPQLYFRARLVP